MKISLALLTLCAIMQSSGIAMVLPTLGKDETRESIDAWKIKTKSYLRAIPAYKPYVDTTWTAKKADSSRGFVDGTGVGDPTAATTLL